MSVRLKSRQKFIPNGFTFYLPELKWRPPRMSSFASIVIALENLVRGNPALAKKNGWPTDRARIEDWVDRYNATLCLRMGWSDYIISDEGALSGSPKLPAPLQSQLAASLSAAAAKARELVRGAKSLNEWRLSGDPAVSPELSTHRAIVCSQCPLNEQGDFTQWFTVPAAELIKRQIEQAQQRKLTTPRDAELNLCLACYCPLKLKVHVPIEWILKRLEPDQIERLKGGKDCWILAEGERI